MATRSTLTYPKGKYVMKKPRDRRKTVLTLDQHAHSQRLAQELEETKRDIVVGAILWEEAASKRGAVNTQNANNMLEHVRQCVIKYKNLMTFPKRSQEIE